MTTLLTYEAALLAFRDDPILKLAVPSDGYYRSWPLPTARWGVPTFAGFACPQTFSDDLREETFEPPTLWWVLSARSGSLMAFNRVEVTPLPAVPSGPADVEPAPARTDAQAGADFSFAVRLLDRAAATFFAGEPGESTLRADVAEVLGLFFPPPLLPWCRVLAPDFFTWSAS